MSRRSNRKDQLTLNRALKIPVLGGLLSAEAARLGAGAASGDLSRSSYNSNASGEGQTIALSVGSGVVCAVFPW